MMPLLRWPGGKRWLTPYLLSLLNAHQPSCLIEPFLGGGALFFLGAPQSAILVDTNSELMTFYRVTKDMPDALMKQLRRLRVDKETFTQVATTQPRSDVERAARVLYLNKTAFGGIWRVNREGRFNVPFGCRSSTRLPSDAEIQRCSRILQDAVLHEGDFSLALTQVNQNALVYCDPPYTVCHNNNGFVRYNENLFSWADQERLAGHATRLALEGRRIVISNAAHDNVLALYSDELFSKVELRRNSRLAPKVEFRGHRSEALIISRSLSTDPLSDLQASGFAVKPFSSAGIHE
jgi:DNA adenine methylase